MEALYREEENEEEENEEEDNGILFDDEEKEVEVKPVPKSLTTLSDDEIDSDALADDHQELRSEEKQTDNHQEEPVDDHTKSLTSSEVQFNPPSATPQPSRTEQSSDSDLQNRTTTPVQNKPSSRLLEMFQRARNRPHNPPVANPAPPAAAPQDLKEAMKPREDEEAAADPLHFTEANHPDSAESSEDEQQDDQSRLDENEYTEAKRPTEADYARYRAMMKETSRSKRLGSFRAPSKLSRR